MSFTPKYPTLYRVYDTIGPSGLSLHWEEFAVIGETPKCWYVIKKSLAYLASLPGYSPCVMRQRKRVLKDQIGKRYCYTDKRRALESYKTRKHWQKSHAKLSAARSEAGHAAAEKLLATGGEIKLPNRAIPNKYIQSLSWECDD